MNNIYEKKNLVALSKSFPNTLSLGLEIRDKVVNYVGEKIRALRIENPGQVKKIFINIFGVKYL